MNFIHHSWRDDPIHPSNPSTDKVLEMVDKGSAQSKRYALDGTQMDGRG